MGKCRCKYTIILLVCMLYYIILLVCLCLPQIDAIVRDYGLVVISRSGSNPEKFIYESDHLSRLQVLGTMYIHH